MFLKRKIPVEDVVMGSLFMILPFLSLPFVFFQTWKRKRYFYLLLMALFFGLLAATSVPTGDLYRQYRDYFSVLDLSFNEFLSSRREVLDFTVPFAIYFLAKLGIGMQWLSAIIVSGFYAVLFWFYHKVSKKNERFQSNVILYFGVMLILVFLIDFMNYALKLRSPLGQLFLFLFFTKLILENRKKYILIVLGVLSHFSSLIAIPVFVLGKYISDKWAKRLFLISLFLLPFTKFLVLFLFNSSQIVLELFPAMNHRIAYYVTGVWAGGYIAELSTNAFIRHYLGVLVYLVAMLFYWFKATNKNKGLLVYFAFVNIMFSFPNIFTRFFIVPVLLSVLTIVKDYKPGDLKKASYFIWFSALFGISMMFGVVNFIAQRRPLKISNINEVMYKSTFQIMGHRYTQEWIDERVNKKGLIIGDEND